MFRETQDNGFIQRVEKGNIETSSSSAFFFFFSSLFFLPNYQDLFEKHVGSSDFVHLSIQRWHNFWHVTLSCTTPITAMSSDQKSTIDIRQLY